jgi:hypothetical protein
MSKVKATAAKCEFCHHQKTTKFCDDCHHGEKQVGRKFDVKVAWTTQHAAATREKGVPGCLEKCHKADFCSDCHTKTKPLPSSHKQAGWLRNKLTVTADPSKASRKPAAPSALHVAAANQQISACEVCHGAGGTKSAFCSGCHKVEMPHPDQFKKFHSGTGKKDPAVCANCHTFKELCSDCHHKGAKSGVAWTAQHPKTVYESGAPQCFENCHKDKNFCVNCHTSGNVVPSTHKAADWLHRRTVSTKAQHTTLFDKQPDGCTYCHGDGGTSSKFCTNCHKLAMPHPDSFGKKGKGNGGDHQKLIKGGKTTKAVCANCHSTAFCNNCHHEGAAGKLPWAVAQVGTPQEHPAVVKAKGSASCFDCHQETFCSYCHVRAAR